MLKFDIRKQPNIKELNEKLVNKLVEEANEVKEAYYNDDIGVDDYIQEILDVQQVLFALYATYVDANTFGIFEHNIKAHNNKLANSHKDRYGLGDIEYYGYINILKPGELTTSETLEKESKYLRDKVKELKEQLEKQNKRRKDLKEQIHNLESETLKLDKIIQDQKDIMYSKDFVINDLRSVIKGLENYIREQDKEINKLRIENGEHREIYSNIEKYLQELKANK